MSYDPKFYMCISQVCEHLVTLLSASLHVYVITLYKLILIKFVSSVKCIDKMNYGPTLHSLNISVSIYLNTYYIEKCPDRSCNFYIFFV
jgi:hypothetical protein